jgi:hypothetical protein
VGRCVSGDAAHRFIVMTVASPLPQVDDALVEALHAEWLFSSAENQRQCQPRQLVLTDLCQPL